MNATYERSSGVEITAKFKGLNHSLAVRHVRQNSQL